MQAYASGKKFTREFFQRFYRQNLALYVKGPFEDTTVIFLLVLGSHSETCSFWLLSAKVFNLLVLDK